MTEFVQPTLPGFPQRLVLAVIWEGADRRCSIRGTLDVPSDAYSSVIEGFDTEGKFTREELADALAVMSMALVDKLT